MFLNRYDVTSSLLSLVIQTGSVHRITFFLFLADVFIRFSGLRACPHREIKLLTICQRTGRRSLGRKCITFYELIQPFIFVTLAYLLKYSNEKLVSFCRFSLSSPNCIPTAYSYLSPTCLSQPTPLAPAYPHLRLPRLLPNSYYLGLVALTGLPIQIHPHLPLCMSIV